MTSVLLIEDDNIFATVLVQALSTHGMNVDVALRAADGISHALDYEYAVILVDLALPGMDGIEVIRQLRNHHYTMHTPIIVCTALSTSEHRKKAADAGCDAFLTKPFSMNELVTTIEAMLS